MVLASRNQGKLKELRELLSGRGWELRLAEGSGPEETGITFAENAYIKALDALNTTGHAGIADDSGICVDALDGAPGVYSARYGGLQTDWERNAYLLRQMEGVTNRKARFICAVCCLFPDGSRIDAYGECGGVILEAPRGNSGFGYDPLLFLPELGKTMSELSPEEKNAVSHRGKAMRELLRKLP